MTRSRAAKETRSLPLPVLFRRARFFVARNVTLLLCCLASAVFAQDAPRLAIADLAGDGQSETALLRQLAKNDFTLIDADLTQSAMRGAAYAGSLNLGREEARSLGLSIGCDYYLLGVVRVARRIVSAEEFYYDGIAGLFAVETRSGRLLLFEFANTTAADEAAARVQLVPLLKQSWLKIKAAIQTAASWRKTESEILSPTPAPLIELLDDATQTNGFAQPVFYQRLKPQYTAPAESLSITATVEIEAVFREDGFVGEVEITRWAGFGLDEAALATVKQLRFKPAQRDGKAVALRALVRYNFRRPPTAAEKKEEADKLKRSLQKLPAQPKPND